MLDLGGSHLKLRNFSIICIIPSSGHRKGFIHFASVVPGVLKRKHHKTEQNRSSTSGPRYLNPMDILKNVFTSRVSSRCLLTTVCILYFNSLIYTAKTKHYLKMGWCNMYPRLQQQKVVSLFISA